MDKDDSPFGVYITRPKLTRKQKCENCQKHKEVPDILCSLKDISMEQLRTKSSENCCYTREDKASRVD